MLIATYLFTIQLTTKVKIPHEFTSLTSIARALSENSERKYSVSSVFENEIIYLASSKETREDYLQKIADIYEAQWDETATGFVLRPNKDRWKLRQNARLKKVRKDYQKLLESYAKENPFSQNSDTLPERISRSQKFSADSPESQTLMRRVPSAPILLSILGQIDLSQLEEMNRSESRYFSNFPHPFTQQVSVGALEENFMFAQTQRDLNYLNSLSEEQKKKLNSYFAISLQTKNIVGRPKYWLRLGNFSATLEVLNEDGSNAQYSSFYFYEPARAAQLPVLSETVLNAPVSARDTKTVDFTKEEALEVYFGNLARKLEESCKDLTLVLPDSVVPFEGGNIRIEDLSRKPLKDWLKVISEQLVWAKNGETLAAYPYETDSQLKARVNREAVIKLVKAKQKVGFIPFSDAVEYLRVQPDAVERNYFEYTLFGLCNTPMYTFAPFLNGLAAREAYRYVGNLSSAQLEKFQRGETAKYAELNQNAQQNIQNLVIKYLNSSESTVPNRPRYNANSPINFFKGINSSVKITPEFTRELSVIQIANGSRAQQIVSASSLGYIAFQQSKGDFGPELGYLPVADSKFRTITQINARLKIEESIAKTSTSFSSAFSPGPIVDSVSALPKEYVDAYNGTFNYYKKLDFKQKNGVPPPLR
jgi:hypothetical protein